MSNSVSVTAADFQSKYAAIRKLQDAVSGKITAAQNDYNDDNIFNASDLPSAALTMEQIQNMSYEDALAVLSTESTTAVNAELTQAQETLSGLVEQFDNLQTQIENLKKVIEEKQNDYDKALRQEEKAENAKAEADEEVTNAQSKITEEQVNYSLSVSKAQSDAYDEALKEYLSQNADEKIPEDDNEEKKEERATSDKQSFQDILKTKLSGISISNSNVENAQQNLVNAKALQDKCQVKLTNFQTKTIEAQQNLTTAIGNYNNKETELTNVETQLSTLENKTIPALEQKMANATFVEQNKQAIAETIFAKDPEVIAAQTTVNNANTTVTNELAKANTAQSAADKAAKDGDITKAETEKENVQNAQNTALKAQQDAKAAEAKIEAQKAALEKLAGVKLTNPATATMTNIDNNVGLIGTALTNATAAVTTANTVSTAQATIATEAATVTTQLGLAKTAQSAAEAALKNNDTETAEAEKSKAEAALKAAKEAQERAKAAQAKLEEVNATDKKATELTALNNNVTSINNVITSITNSIKQANVNKEAAATREAAGVKFATSVDAVTGECSKDVNKLDLTSMISAEELAIVEANNLDLTELIDNGDGTYSPKYFIATGASDGKWHIYQRSTTIDLDKYEKNLKKSKGRKEHATDYFAIDIARIYNSDAGLNICSVYNGYMRKYGDSDTAKSGYKEVYYLTCNNEDYSSCNFGNTFKSYGTCSPLSLDLNGDGVKTSENVIDYDIDGDGVLDKINDSADAVLVFDADGDGISGEDGKECFGNNTDLDGDGKADGYSDGFAALKALALKHNLINNEDDMILDENDLQFLALSCGLKLKANGYNSEAQSLSDLGVTQISFANTDKTTMVDDFDGMGNQIMYQSGTTCTVNGKEQEVADIWHQKKQFLSLTAA